MTHTTLTLKRAYDFKTLTYLVMKPSALPATTFKELNEWGYCRLFPLHNSPCWHYVIIAKEEDWPTIRQLLNKHEPFEIRRGLSPKEPICYY